LTIWTWTTASPLGPIHLAANDRGLIGLWFEQRRHGPTRGPDWVENPEPFGEAVDQLDSYFAGNLRRFDLPLDQTGTEFQHAVWDALTTIPYGETITYRELAERSGRPKAIRAAGAANGRNQISIVIPCHRVVGSDGTLTDYGGGLERKQALLGLERSS
jgi:methylated-DNA-[protein]-cysteine S-methyltransferase